MFNIQYVDYMHFCNNLNKKSDGKIVPNLLLNCVCFKKHWLGIKKGIGAGAAGLAYKILILTVVILSIHCKFCPAEKSLFLKLLTKVLDRDIFRPVTGIYIIWRKQIHFTSG
jgi:hypothetical protein